MSTSPRTPGFLWVALVVLLVSATTHAGGASRARSQLPAMKPGAALDVRSPGVAAPAALSDSMRIWRGRLLDSRRAVLRRTPSCRQTEKQNYDLLYPLLDMTTSLDPHFNIAVSVRGDLPGGGVSGGPGPDQAIALLEKGIARDARQVGVLQDIGFVHYWWLHDYAGRRRLVPDARRSMPGAPNWLRAARRERAR